jgi:hypothetical protein
VLVLVGCGSPASPPATPVGPPASLVAAPRTTDDVIVARVNSRPVFASCVAAQGKAHHLAARAALDECIAFELMAQEAERRAIDRDHEVVLATKTALVSRLVADAYEDGLTDPKVFGDTWVKFLDKFDWHIKHENYRASTYVRIPLPDKASPEADAKAHALADQIAAAVAPERGMLSAHLRAIAERFTPPLVTPCRTETTVPCYDDVPPIRVGSLEDHYGPALFALTEIGRATPAIRTKWGWDVIVWTDDVPETNPSAAEVTQKMLPEFKQFYFGTWVRQVEKQLGIHVEIEPDVSALLGSQT